MDLNRILLSIVLGFICSTSGCKTCPQIYNNFKVNALTSHKVVITGYLIPKGIFRGAIQPLESHHSFEIWNIEKGKECWYNIPAPPEFCYNQKESTADWNISLLENHRDDAIYEIKRKDGKVAFQVQLPMPKREYTFYVLKYEKEHELIVFSTLSEFVDDVGVFGYVIFRENK
jgi:hypothetical protein